jgi:hypothetical protein
VWWQWPAAAFIEIKAEGDRLSKLQTREIERMEMAGVPVYVAHSIAEIDAIVAEIRA